jgi:hypothetical protein
MRRASCRYHYAVHELCKNEDVVKEVAFDAALVTNDMRNCWNEVSKIRRTLKNLLDAIDSISNNEEIANVFANT